MGRFIDAKAVRRPENAMTGLRLTPSGHALAAGVGAATVGVEALRAQTGPAVVNKQPGVQQPLSTQNNFRQSPNVGATGELAMALSDLQQAEGVSGLQ